VTKAVGDRPELSGGAREGIAMPLPRHDLPDHSTKVQVKVHPSIGPFTAQSVTKM